MTHEIFLMRVMHRTGLDDRANTEQLTDHVLTHLAHCLGGHHAAAIADDLPDELGAVIRDHAGGDPVDLDTLYRSVAERLDVDVSFGLEFTQVVCQVLGEAVGTSGRDRLQSALDEPWHPLFEPRQGTMTPPANRRDDRRTLSSAEPGSSRPLSEAKPGHRNSIAHTDRPQLGTKLSTSRGKPERRTLAGGKPGSSRPISEH